MTCSGFDNNADFFGITASTAGFLNQANVLNKITNILYELTAADGALGNNFIQLRNDGAGWFLKGGNDMVADYSTGTQANTACTAIPTGSYGNFAGTSGPASGSVS